MTQLTWPLPQHVLDSITQIASEADALFFGEIHGTHETPVLIASLLPALFDFGYRAFGIEAPAGETRILQKYLKQPNAPVPIFYAEPWQDGRGSIEMLDLCRTCARIGMEVFCFDQGFNRPNASWSARDASMAQNTLAYWKAQGITSKIALICGNNHAFLRPHPQMPAELELWPSFAHHLGTLLPEKAMRSIEIVPARGTFYNFGVQTLEGTEAVIDEIRLAESGSCSLRVIIPSCTPATYLRPPGPPSQRFMFRMLIDQIKSDLEGKLKRK